MSATLRLIREHNECQVTIGLNLIRRVNPVLYDRNKHYDCGKN